jgi:hypothetical protein
MTNLDLSFTQSNVMLDIIIEQFQRRNMQHQKMTVFWDVAPCSLLEIDRRFRGACCLHDRCDDGGSKHLWNIGQFLRDCTATSQKAVIFVLAAVRTPNITWKTFPLLVYFMEHDERTHSISIWSRFSASWFSARSSASDVPISEVISLLRWSSVRTTYSLPGIGSTLQQVNTSA